MRHLKLLSICGLLFCLFGCATGARMENMAYDGASKNYDKVLKNEVSLLASLGGKDTNPLWTSEISNHEFSGAVKKSLLAEGLLSETGRYQLTVHLLKVKQPIMGLSMTVTTHVQYVLKDSVNGTIVLDKTVIAPYTAAFGDSLIGVKRLRLANEGSGKKNIKGLLEELSSLKISSKEISFKD